MQYSTGDERGSGTPYHGGTEARRHGGTETRRHGDTEKSEPGVEDCWPSSPAEPIPRARVRALPKVIAAWWFGHWERHVVVLAVLESHPLQKRQRTGHPARSLACARIVLVGVAAKNGANRFHEVIRRARFMSKDVRLNQFGFSPTEQLKDRGLAALACLDPNPSLL